MHNILLAAVLSLASIPALAGGLEAEIEARALAFEAAFNAGDGAGVAAFYTPDAAILPPGAARIDGREGISTFWTGAIESGLTDLDLVITEVIAAGDSAIDVGTLTLTAPGEGGTRATVAGKYVVQWQRVDAVWHLHRDIWNMGQ